MGKISKCIRCVGVRLRQNWWIIQRYTHILDYFVVAGLLLAGAYLIWKLKAAQTLKGASSPEETP